VPKYINEDALDYDIPTEPLMGVSIKVRATDSDKDSRDWQESPAPCLTRKGFVTGGVRTLMFVESSEQAAHMRGLHITELPIHDRAERCSD
jgi:hypothetical protein